MNNPNPIDVILWTLRRKEGDVVNLYDYLSGLMQVSTGGNFLNFGYWNDTTKDPLESQKNLCKIVGELAELGSSKFALDIGSGFSEPSFLWRKTHPSLKITCININSNQLISANKKNKERSYEINLLNCTAVKIPVADKSCDRIIALESAQHFRPIEDFISETRRILEKDGIAVIAIPILSRPLKIPIVKMGILKFTWSSEHYDLERIKKIIQENDLDILETRMIGSNVYLPLAEYYIKNRQLLQGKILEKYPPYVEKILFRSMQKMKQASIGKTIEYALVKFKK